MSSVPAITKDMLQSFFSAQSDYLHGNFAGAKATLDAFFARHPDNDPNWGVTTWIDPNQGTTPDFGFPAGYTALTMLSRVANWRVSRANGSTPLPVPAPLVLGVYSVQHSNSLLPADLAQLEAGQGVATALEIAPQVSADNYQFIQDGIWLFSEYILAASDGRLQLAIDPVQFNSTLQLNYTYLPATSTAPATMAASFGANGTGDLGIVDSLYGNCDLVLALYPGMSQALFAKLDLPFIGGGGEQKYESVPVLISGDVGFLSTPNATPTQVAAAGGSMVTKSLVERELSLTAWVAHEWFHGAAAGFPQYQLDDPTHRWYNPALWPSDYTISAGEGGYFDQSVEKRFLTGPDGLDGFVRNITPHAPRRSDLYPLTLKAFTGTYVAAPGSADSTNPYFSGGTINLAVSGGPSQLLWKNNAGSTSLLTPQVDTSGHLVSLTMSIAGTSNLSVFTLARSSSGPYTSGIATFTPDGEHTFIPNP